MVMPHHLRCDEHSRTLHPGERVYPAVNPSTTDEYPARRRQIGFGDHRLYRMSHSDPVFIRWCRDRQDMPLAGHFGGSWITERRLLVVDAISSLPMLAAWYVLLGGGIQDGISLIETPAFGTAILLFSVSGIVLATTLGITSIIRCAVADLSVHQLDTVFVSMYLIGLLTFVATTSIADTTRPTGAGGILANGAVFSMTVSAAILSVVVLARLLMFGVDTDRLSDKQT